MKKEQIEPKMFSQKRISFITESFVLGASYCETFTEMF